MLLLHFRICKGGGGKIIILDGLPSGSVKECIARTQKDSNFASNYTRRLDLEECHSVPRVKLMLDP